MIFRIKPNIFIYHYLLITVLLFAFYTGFRGIDYGHHWDELRIISSVNDSIDNGIILPGWYHYPSIKILL